MKKLQFSDLMHQQLIDIRSQHEYQKGHLEGSLNLNPGNFKKYASYYLDKNQPLVFIVEDENQELLEDLSAAAEEYGFSKNAGYLLAGQLPENTLNSLPTISVKDFLDLEDDYILLDVRHPEEITRPAPEKNLVNLPFEQLINETQRLNKDQIIYTLCGSGNRSTAAASYLASQGFDSIVIEGGMKAVQEKQENK